MGGLFGGGPKISAAPAVAPPAPPPAPPPPAVMPVVDDAVAEKARRRKLLEQTSLSGRQSTMLSEAGSESRGGAKLGG